MGGNYKLFVRGGDFKRSLGAHRAVALVETALILPVLVLLVFGLFEYGWMFVRTQQITNAARHGVRVAARADSTATEAREAALTMLQRSGLKVAGDNITVTPEALDAVSPGEPVTVSVSVPYPEAGIGIPLFAKLNLVPSVLRASVSMAREGP